MKVLMINGSPHKEGNTALALREIASQLEKQGIDSEIVWIGNKPVRGCIACGSCANLPGRCVFDDDVCNRISGKFAEADALVVGSPVYYGQPNGALLSIIQRALYSNSGALAGKPAASVAVCRRGGYFHIGLPRFDRTTLSGLFSVGSSSIVEAAFLRLGFLIMQTMRALANNLAHILKSTGGKPAPGRGDEPREATHFIR